MTQSIRYQTLHIVYIQMKLLHFQFSSTCCIRSSHESRMGCYVLIVRLGYKTSLEIEHEALSPGGMCPAVWRTACRTCDPLIWDWLEFKSTILIVFQSYRTQDKEAWFSSCFRRWGCLFPDEEFTSIFTLDKVFSVIFIGTSYPHEVVLFESQARRNTLCASRTTSFRRTCVQSLY